MIFVLFQCFFNERGVDHCTEVDNLDNFESSCRDGTMPSESETTMNESGIENEATVGEDGQKKKVKKNEVST